MKPDEPLQEATAVLLEFLEVAVHQVLYNRGVYPSAVFERRRKYDVPVFMSRHPDLNLYIHEVLQAAGGMLMEGSVDKIVLTLYGDSNNDDAQTPLESFAFELSSSPFLIQALAEGSLEDPFPAFRKVLARISVAEEVAELAPVPHDVTFALLLATRPHQQQQQQHQLQGKGGMEGEQEGGGVTVPPAWAAAISSGEFAPGGPESYLATTIPGRGGGGGGEGGRGGGTAYLNLVNWENFSGGGGGGGGGAEGGRGAPHMRVVVRSRLHTQPPPTARGVR